MRGLVKSLALMCLLQDVAHSQLLDGVNEFCSDVRRMYTQCGNYGSGGSYTVKQRGKAGPKGEKGEQGSDATIDYETVERMLQQKIENLNVTTKTDCSDVLPGTFKLENGSRPVYQLNIAGERIDASCDLTTDGGGWTVIQRRMDGSVDFFRTHTDYVSGFGSVTGEFWIGLHNLYNILQTSEQFQLRIDMEDWDGVKKFAKYSQFSIGEPKEDYPLTVTGFSGSVPDSFSALSGSKFSTRDRDVDSSSGNCAQSYKGGWWYASCHASNLNGLYHRGSHDSYADGINWQSWRGYYYSLKFIEMKIKPLA